jgi:hypothetical protein
MNDWFSSQNVIRVTYFSVLLTINFGHKNHYSNRFYGFIKDTFSSENIVTDSRVSMTTDFSHKTSLE